MSKSHTLQVTPSLPTLSALRLSCAKGLAVSRGRPAFTQLDDTSCAEIHFVAIPPSIQPSVLNFGVYFSRRSENFHLPYFLGHPPYL